MKVFWADFRISINHCRQASGNFFDGFYFGDVKDGKDIDEFAFEIGASLAASLDLLVASQRHQQPEEGLAPIDVVALLGFQERDDLVGNE